MTTVPTPTGLTASTPHMSEADYEYLEELANGQWENEGGRVMHTSTVVHRHAGIDWVSAERCPICTRDERIGELEGALHEIVRAWDCGPVVEMTGDEDINQCVIAGRKLLEGT